MRFMPPPVPLPLALELVDVSETFDAADMVDGSAADIFIHPLVTLYNNIVEPCQPATPRPVQMLPLCHG